ncbi:thyroid peroxidase-like, partial [Polymixia lowei]
VHKVSKNIMKTSSKRRDAVYTQLLVEFGQYIDHDINLTPQLNKGATCANTCENAHPCFPIQFHNVPSGAQSCMPFYRSSPACFANFGSDIKQILQRQQMNAITSFIDASAVYGCTPKLQSLLRDLTSPDGRLATNNHFQDLRGRPYLPFVSSVESSCLQDPRDLQGQRMECFLAGDKRVNEVPTLISLHTLFVREHNRIAKALKGLNGHWSRETVYQETRKIIGALHQIITMRDYIPKIIGSDGFDSYIGPYGGYDPAVDPSASNVFTTAAFRFGHATISPVIWRLNESFQEDEHFPHLTVYSALFSPWKIYREDSEGGIDPIIRGVIGTAAIAVSTDKLIPEAVTEKMVVPFIPQDIDLAAVDLQRGRDHALPDPDGTCSLYSPKNDGQTTMIFKVLRYQDRSAILQGACEARKKVPIQDAGKTIWFYLDYSAFTNERRKAYADMIKELYKRGIPTFLIYPATLKMMFNGYNDWRAFCGLKRIMTQDDLRDVVKDSRVAQKILQMYKHPDNIDVWLGGLVEDLVPGSRNGPLFSCLIGKQMKALRDGDRFWWEAQASFTQEQRAELSKLSLSRTICDNTDVKEVPLDVFKFRKYPDGFLACRDIPSMSLEAWREEKSRGGPDRV